MSEQDDQDKADQDKLNRSRFNWSDGDVVVKPAPKKPTTD